MNAHVVSIDAESDLSSECWGHADRVQESPLWSEELSFSVNCDFIWCTLRLVLADLGLGYLIRIYAFSPRKL